MIVLGLYRHFLKEFKIGIRPIHTINGRIRNRRSELLFYTIIIIFIPSLLRQMSTVSSKTISDTTRRRHFLNVAKKMMKLEYDKSAMQGLDCASLLSDETASNTRMRSSDLLVSIITPVFNPLMSELIETADCVLSQTYQNWNWIIVDDYSRSYYAEMWRKLSELDHRIKIIQKSDLNSEVYVPNLGKARNTGLNYSNGEYVFFLDGDDKMHPTTIEKMVQFLSIHEHSHFVSAYVKAFGFSSHTWIGDLNPSWKFKEKNMVIATSLHRKHSLQAVGNYSVRKNGLEDWDTWLKYANANKWGGTIPETLLYVRTRPSQTDRWKDLSSFGKQQFKDRINIDYPKLSEKINWPVSPLEVWRNVKLTPENNLTSIISTNLPSSCCHGMIVLDRFEHGVHTEFYFDLLSGLKRLKWRITIVLISSYNTAWFELFQNIYQDIFVLNSLGSPMTYLNTITNIIRQRSIDIIIVGQSYYGYHMLPYLREAFPYCAFVENRFSEINKWNTKKNRIAVNSIDPYIDYVLVSSEYLKRRLIDLGYDSKKLEVLYRGLNSSTWFTNYSEKRLAREALGFSPRDIVILCKTDLEPIRNPLLIVETAIKVLKAQKKERSENIYFLILGSGSLSSKVKKTIRKQPENIKKYLIYFNDVPHHFTPLIIRTSDIAFDASSVSGIPNSYYEFMAMGSVIVGFDVGGVNEIVEDNATGLLVPSNSFSCQKEPVLRRDSSDFWLAAEIFEQKLSKLVHFTEFRERLSENAQKKIKNFSLDKMVEALDSSLRNLISMVKTKRGNKVMNREKVKDAIHQYERLYFDKEKH